MTKSSTGQVYDGMKINKISNVINYFNGEGGTGAFLANKQHGKGKCTYLDGRTYTGTPKYK